jgi:ATP-binding cassette subfamily B (MDR/TAP) protein 8
MVSKLGENLSKRIRNDLYYSLMNQEISLYDSKMHGDLLSRLTQDVADFKVTLTQIDWQHTFKSVLTQGLKGTAQIIGTTIQLFSISSHLTFIILSTTPILYLSLNYYGTYLRSLSKAARKSESDASGIAGEALSNIRTVRAFNGEEIELKRYETSVEEASKLNTRLGFHIGLFQGMPTASFTILGLTNSSIGSLILLILYYGGNKVINGEISGGELMTYLVATQSCQRALASVGVLFGQTIKAFGSASRVFELIDLEKKDSCSCCESTKCEVKGDIRFRNVFFAV